MGKKFNASNSLLGMGLVDKVERVGETYYRLSERGKSVIEKLNPDLRIAVKNR
jgi:predicted transcriptional regulator with HTH domain